MKYEAIERSAAPRPAPRTTAEQSEYDNAVRTLISGEANALIAITVEPEADEKSIRVRLARAAGRAGIKVRTWYDPPTAKVYCELK